MRVPSRLPLSFLPLRDVEVQSLPLDLIRVILRIGYVRVDHPAVRHLILKRGELSTKLRLAVEHLLLAIVLDGPCCTRKALAQSHCEVRALAAQHGDASLGERIDCPALSEVTRRRSERHLCRGDGAIAKVGSPWIVSR